MPKIIFQKKEFQVWDFESFRFWSKVHFLGDFFSAFFKIFCRRRTTVANIFTQPPSSPYHHHKKLPTALKVMVIDHPDEEFFRPDKESILDQSLSDTERKKQMIDEIISGKEIINKKSSKRLKKSDKAFLKQW